MIDILGKKRKIVTLKKMTKQNTQLFRRCHISRTILTQYASPFIQKEEETHDYA